MSISDSLTKLKFKFLLKPCLKALNSLVSTGYFKVAVHHNGQYTPLRILTFFKKKILGLRFPATKHSVQASLLGNSYFKGTRENFACKSWRKRHWSYHKTPYFPVTEGILSCCSLFTLPDSFLQNDTHWASASWLSFSRIAEATGRVGGCVKDGLRGVCFWRLLLKFQMVRFDMKPRSCIYPSWFSL